MPEHLTIAVIGSVNLDLAASVERLPVAGETLTDATLNRFPGGKGANQALAARRLGVNVQLIACVGRDSHADEALALLVEGDVDLSRCARIDDRPTGVALIAVAASGENQIIVAPGANRSLSPERVGNINADALIGQLEVPVETLTHVSKQFGGFLCLNLAPAKTVPPELIGRADLVVVNETEAQFYGALLDACRGYVATTLGKEGATLKKDGKVVANAGAPEINAVDATGAGDAFTAALTVALLEGQPESQALKFACAAGAAAATKAGAQPSLPDRAAVLSLLASMGGRAD